MKKTVKSIGVSLLALIMLLSFGACTDNAEQEYYSKVVEISEKVGEVSNEINGMTLTSQTDFDLFVEKLEKLNNYINELAELETPENYTEAQELFKSAGDKLEECLELYQGIEDITAEDAGTKATEAAGVYADAITLLTEAATKTDEIYES